MSTRVDINILFAIDSITRHDDSYNFDGFRRACYDVLTTSLGFPYTSRGSTLNGTWPQPRHSAVSGQTINGARALFATQLGPSGTIDGHGNMDGFILCAGAGNLIAGSYVPGVTCLDLIAMVEEIIALEVNTQLVALGTVMPFSGDPANVEQYNQEIRGVVLDTLRAEYPSVRFRLWDMWAAFGGVYNSDYYIAPGDPHPNALGSYTLAGINTLVPAVAADFNALTWGAPEDEIMGTLGTAAKNKQLDHLRNVAAYSPAANHYLHLYADEDLTVPLTAGTASGYVAKVNTNNSVTWLNQVGRLKASGVVWNFPTPTGTWPDVCGWKLTDNATEGAGTLLASDSHDPVPVSVSTGYFAYEIGDITITAATNVGGGLSDLALASVMNLMFGGVADVPLVTTYGAWIAGDPAGAGVQAGSRVAITQASTWAAASGGVSATSASIALAEQVTGTYWAEYTASSGGSLLYSAPRPSGVGASGTIAAGELLTTLT